MKLTQKNNAFSLVELMVAMVLGLILLAGIFTVYLSTQQTSRTADGVIKVQNDAQLALSFLKNDIAKAGWVNNSSIYYSLPSPLGTNFASTEGKTGPDSISIQYESCDDSVAGNLCYVGDLKGLDQVTCTGEKVAGGDIINNVYSVKDGVLICTSNSKSIPLVDNVSDFQVLYGQVTSNGLVYVTADNITDVSSIHSARFALVLSSERDTSNSQISRTIQVLDNTFQPNDKKLHLKYESTVVLLNKPTPLNSGI